MSGGYCKPHYGFAAREDRLPIHHGNITLHLYPEEAIMGESLEYYIIMRLKQTYTTCKITVHDGIYFVEYFQSDKNDNNFRYFIFFLFFIFLSVVETYKGDQIFLRRCIYICIYDRPT